MRHWRKQRRENVDAIESSVRSSYWSAPSAQDFSSRFALMRAGMPALRSGSNKNGEPAERKLPRCFKRINFRLEDELDHHLRTPRVVLLVRRRYLAECCRPWVNN